MILYHESLFETAICSAVAVTENVGHTEVGEIAAAVMEVLLLCLESKK